MSISFVDFTGFVEAVLPLAAFFLITSGQWSAKTGLYQVFNTVAGGLLAYYT